MTMLYSQRLKLNVVVYSNDFASGVILLNNERVGFN